MHAESSDIIPVEQLARINQLVRLSTSPTLPHRLRSLLPRRDRRKEYEKVAAERRKIEDEVVDDSFFIHAGEARGRISRVQLTIGRGREGVRWLSNSLSHHSRNSSESSRANIGTGMMKREEIVLGTTLSRSSSISSRASDMTASRTPSREASTLAFPISKVLTLNEDEMLERQGTETSMKTFKKTANSIKKLSILSSPKEFSKLLASQSRKITHRQRDKRVPQEDGGEKVSTEEIVRALEELGMKESESDSPRFVLEILYENQRG